MATITLEASPRTVEGKQVKHLRRDGLVPGVIYGHSLKSVSIQVPINELQRVARQTGTSSMVELRLEGETRPRNVLLRRITNHSISGQPMHVDLYEVRMDEPITAEVPLHLTGTAPAIADEAGIVLSMHNHLRVRSLPGNMPAAIAVDLSGLAHIDDTIHVRDLHLPEGVEALLDPDDILVRVNAPKVAAEEIPTEITEQPQEAPGEAAAEGSEASGA